MSGSFFMESETSPTPMARANFPLLDNLYKAVQTGLYHEGGRAMLFTLPFFLCTHREAAAHFRQPGDCDSTVQQERRKYRPATLETFMQVSNSTCRKVGNSHIINSIYTNALKTVSYYGCTCGRGKTNKQTTLLNCMKWFSGEILHFDYTRKQTGQIFIAWCC